MTIEAIATERTHHPAMVTELPTVDLSTSPLWNRDLAPTTLGQRTWSVWSIAALWISMSACIPTYQLASSLVDGGMNWWQAILTIFLGNVIVLFPMVLNAHAGTKYGIPFPVYCRAGFGTWGANVPALLRAFVACGWFGIQTWIGGAALFQIACVFKPELKDAAHMAYLGVSQPAFIAFMGFWLVNMIVIFLGINSIRWLLNIKAPLLIVFGLALVIWAAWKAGGFGPMLGQPSAFAAGQPKAGQFWLFFFPALTGMVGFWATLSLNIPDFSRYAKTQRDQVLGQAMGLPTTMALYSFIGVAVTSATVVIYGKTIWDPVVLLGMFQNKVALVIAMSAVAIATLATNIAANVVSPANDFAHLAPRWIGFRLGGLLTGLIGIAMMPWKLIADPSGYIFTWLIAYSSLLGAIGGILICDYWVLRRTQLSVEDLFNTHGRYRYDRGINWCALLAMAIAISLCIPGFVDTVGHGRMLQTTKLGTFFKDLYNYGWFVTFAVSFVLYAVFMIKSPSVRLDRAGPRRASSPFQPTAAVIDDKSLPLPVESGSTTASDIPTDPAGVSTDASSPVLDRPRKPLFASGAPVVTRSEPLDLAGLPLDQTLKVQAALATVSTDHSVPDVAAENLANTVANLEPTARDAPVNNDVPVHPEVPAQEK